MNKVQLIEKIRKTLLAQKQNRVLMDEAMVSKQDINVILDHELVIVKGEEVGKVCKTCGGDPNTHDMECEGV